LLPCCTCNIEVPIKNIDGVCELTNLTIWDDFDFKNLEQCTGSIFTIINSTIPKMTLNFTSKLLNIKFITITNSKLEKIELDAFGAISGKNWEKLQKLDISSNKLTNLENSTFVGATGLTKLYLSFNKINHIAVGAFSTLKKLEKLKLDNNQITELEQGLFDDLVSLRKLELFGNKIKNINMSIFEKNTNLKHVYLGKNILSSFDSSMENNVIENLFLKNTSLTCIPNLKNLMGLKYLDLSNNPQLDLTCTEFPKNLNNLSLNGNNLMNNTLNVTSLTKLIWLELESTNLQSFSHIFWPTKGNLKTLDVSNNELTDIEVEMFKDVFSTNNVSIDIDGNDWNCEALEKFTAKYKNVRLQHGRISISKIKESGICLVGDYFPKRLQYLKEKILDNSKMMIVKQTKPKSYIVTSTATIFSIMCIIILVISWKYYNLKNLIKKHQPKPCTYQDITVEHTAQQRQNQIEDNYDVIKDATNDTTYMTMSANVENGDASEHVYETLKYH
jgi:Leucine-rich repeat (LRR) protein